MATRNLWLILSLFTILVALLDRTDFFRKALFRTTSSISGQFLLVALFSAIGISGTYWSIIAENGTINARAVGVIAGGLSGGALVGLVTGFIVGLHRFLFLDNFTAMESAAITVLQGCIAGILSGTVKKRKKIWPCAFIIGFALEALHMALLLVFAAPFDKALALVKAIAPPMLVTNSVGIAIFTGIMEDTYKRNESLKAATTKAALCIANLSSSISHMGFNDRSAKESVKSIIKATSNFDCAAILANRQILALACDNPKDEKAIARFLDNFIGRGYPDELDDAAPIQAKIVRPIYKGNIQVATLFFGKRGKEPVSELDIELALGLGDLISAQIEIAEVKERAKLLVHAELKALQCQINPHFLFNTLNAISYYCRSKPATAKKLITYLADYYRHNLSDSGVMVSFQQELQHINAYVSIEMARFGERLQMQYDFDKNTDFKLPALIMQPLVENAIKHGLRPKENGGTVRIGAVKQEGSFELSVSDDGVGIDAAKLGSLLEADAARTSIGLCNVHKRLITIYGPDCGLNINSQKNGGTVVSFKIPILQGGQTWR
ncbi:MAG: histidine kinase [Acidaminococcales bacterium]|nr:histidine kinase [Acidaminococcales bacterium]